MAPRQFCADGGHVSREAGEAMMPTARESLLDAASAALAARPWPEVRMVDVAAAAGVSRQTLYNEFGGKDGLARALVRRAADAYLAGVDRALAGPAGADGDADPGRRLAAIADWTVHSAQANPLVRAVLTGFWGERLPTPVRVTPSVSYVPAQRRADASVPSPVQLLGQVRDRALAALGPGRPKAEAEHLARACDVAVRLALSYVVAPAEAEDPARLIKVTLGR
jgi:AcrR family transcriptional regulator